MGNWSQWINNLGHQRCGVSMYASLEASGAGVVSVLYLSSMFFMLPVLNSSLYSLSPDGRKLASGAMAEALAASVVAVVSGTVAEKRRHLGWIQYLG